MPCCISSQRFLDEGNESYLVEKLIPGYKDGRPKGKEMKITNKFKKAKKPKKQKPKSPGVLGTLTDYFERRFTAKP